MKKLLIGFIVLVGSTLSVASYATTFETCKIGASDFCQCFVKNCEKVYDAGACSNHTEYKHLIESVGVRSICQKEQPHSVAQCISAIDLYISPNSPCK